MTQKNEVEWNTNEVNKVLASSSPVSHQIDLFGPLTEGIFFSDDYWDFSKWNKLNREKGNYKFEFSSISTTFKYYIKIRVLKNLFLFDNTFSTAKPKFYNVIRFIKWLEQEQLTLLEQIDLYNIKRYFKQEHFQTVCEEYLHHNKYAIKEFIEEIENKHGSKVSFLDVYEYLEEKDSGLVKAQREEGKHPFIHQNVLNKMVSLAIKDMDNITLSLTDRMSSCMVVLLAETGMRIGEFEILEINKLKELSINDEDEIFYFLEFITFKTTVEKDGRIAISFMTSNAVKAYKTLLDLTKERREKTNTNYLYITPKGTKYSAISVLRKHHIRFFVRHQSELEFNKMSQKNLKNYHLWIPKMENITQGTRGIVSHQDIGKKIYYVTPHQYRVTCATILYEKGYKLDWIREHMNHLDDAMTAHYIRIRDLENKKEQLKQTFRLRANKDGSLLETNIEKINNESIKQELLDEELKKEYLLINKFLKKLEKKKIKLNLFNDIDEVIDILLLSDTPLIETELGYCASNALSILCERQKYISTINDAYYIGPYVPNIDSLNFNYTRYLEKTKIIYHNMNLFEKDERYRNQYELEMNGLKKFIKNRLLPELEELKGEVIILGVENVVKKYDGIEHIAKNIDEIISEVLQWKSTLLPSQLVTS